MPCCTPPYKAAAKSYGSHRSVADFETIVLTEPGFEVFVLLPDQVQAVAKRLGPLKEGEVYYPVPYPMMGGSDLPETYQKGNVWTFASIVAQLLGHD